MPLARREFLLPPIQSVSLAPAARHFFVHASAFSLAPLAPHLSSLTQPLTVALFPISSNAIAVRANTKHIARHSTNTFLMADFSPFEIQIAAPSRHNHSASRLCRPFWSSRYSLSCEMKQRKYTTQAPRDCQPVVKTLTESFTQESSQATSSQNALRALSV